MKSERGQRQMIFIAIVALIVIAFLLAGMAANQRGMQQGANTIGDAVGNTIDNAFATETDQDRLNLEWQLANGTVVSAWVNNQRIPANPRAIEHHTSGGAVEAIKCYNDHGVFFIQANKKGDWYFHCLEEDGKTVRTTFWQRVGKQFHLQTAYTKGDGAWSWSQIRTFFETKWGATKAVFPSDGVLYVDGVPAPYVP